MLETQEEMKDYCNYSSQVKTQTHEIIIPSITDKMLQGVTDEQGIRFVTYYPVSS